MFVTSNEEDRDEDGTVDYKYGLADNHRLLGAITEVNTAGNIIPFCQGDRRMLRR